MISTITNLDDVHTLRYDIIRSYDNKLFNGQLKAFAVEQLDLIIDGTIPLADFIASRDIIEQGSKRQYQPNHMVHIHHLPS